MFLVTTIWFDVSGGSWIDSKTKGEDELKGWFKNPGLNHWLVCWSSSSESDVIISLGLVEFSCVGWISRVASEGKATLKGLTPSIGSSYMEGILSEAGDLWVEYFLLARFLNAMPTKMLECVTLRW